MGRSRVRSAAVFHRRWSVPWGSDRPDWRLWESYSRAARSQDRPAEPCVAFTLQLLFSTAGEGAGPRRRQGQPQLAGVAIARPGWRLVQVSRASDSTNRAVALSMLRVLPAARSDTTASQVAPLDRLDCPK